MPTIKREATYVFTDLSKGNNKFWTITEYDDSTIKTEWGQIGAKNPQSKTFEEYEKDYDKECAKKIKKGYHEAQTLENASKDGGKPLTNISVKKAAREQIKTNCKECTKLIDLLIQQNVHQILSNTTMSYNAQSGMFSTPVGVIDQSGIDEARKLLNKIRKYLKAGNKHEDDQTILNEYFMIIPQKLPRKKNRVCPELAIPDVATVLTQNSLLDSLQASIDLISQGSPNSVTEDVFSTKLELDKNHTTLKKIKALYNKTRKTMHASHNLDVHKVYKVTIDSVHNAFIQKGKPIGNVMRLWHGTRVSNVLSILSKGLIIPPASAAHCTGRMYGNGLYFSDQSTKSLNYASGYWGGGGSSQCYMFICDVAMGKPHNPRSSSRNLPAPGTDSTFAKGGSSVMNNEMIVYNTYQCDLKYLVEFK